MHVDVQRRTLRPTLRCATLKNPRERPPIGLAVRPYLPDEFDLALCARVAKGYDKVGLRRASACFEVLGSGLSPLAQGVAVDAGGLGGDFVGCAGGDGFGDDGEGVGVEFVGGADWLSSSVGAACLAACGGAVAAGLACLGGFAAEGAVG